MSLLRVRGSLVRTRTRWINVVRALARGQGYRIRSGEPESFGGRVSELESHLPAHLTRLLQVLVELLDGVNEKIAGLDREIAALGKRDPRVRLLQTTPMVGPLTATAFVALIDDVSRFKKAHGVENYVGLVPSEWSSSEKRLKLGITKRGDCLVRWLLVEASWSIMTKRRPDTLELRRWASNIASRRKRKVAVVALARRLAGILYAMLRDNKPFDPTRLGQASRTQVA